MNVDAEFEAQVNEAISHYPVSKRSAALPLLHLWQEKFGHVSQDGVRWIANKLELQPIHIQELVTFYPMFRQQAIGKYHIKVCRTLSCAMGGSYGVFEHFKKLTGATGNEHGAVTSPDGRYTVEFVECLAACGNAPVVMVNDECHMNVDQQKAEQMLQTFRAYP